MDTLPKDIVIVGARRGRRRVRQHVPRRRRQGDRCSSTCRGSCRSRTREVSKLRRAQLHQARHHGHDQRPLRRGVGHGRQGRHLPDGRARGQGAGRAPGRADARRRPAAPPTSRTSASRRPRSRPTAASSRSTAGCGPRSRTSTRSATSSAACGSPTRRPTRGIIAAHTIAGEKDVHEIDYIEPAAGDLLPAGDRLDRADRGAVRGAGPRRSRSARSRSRRSPRRSSAASTRASPRSSPTPRPTTRSASTSSGRTPPTSSPRRRSAFTLEATPWEIGGATHAAPDALRGHRRGGHGRRRPVDQLLAQAAGHRPGDTRRPDQQRWRSPGQRLAPRRRRRPDRRRPRRDVPATSPSRAPSTSGCGSSTGPAGSRS